MLHVHATEFDRSGGGENGFVTAIERAGAAAADRVVAVSGYTADVLATRYGVPRERLRVVHNAIDPREPEARFTIGEEDPLVLFAGRITWQKGPDYFVDAAERVAAEMPRVKFAVAGSGDRMRAMMQRVAARGLEERFLFTGFLPPDDLDRLYARADVYVMPSVSEPFGLTALEALQHGTPVIVSRSAGVVRGGPERAPRPTSATSRTSPRRSCRSCSFRRCATRSRRAAARTCGGSRGGNRRGGA